MRYEYTSVNPMSSPENLAIIRRMVMQLMLSLEWRHHGIGTLQAYIPFANTESRIHIWHPDLVIPGMEVSGQIHDHRFDLCSFVVYGSIRHDEYHLTESASGEWCKWTVLNASRGAEPPVLADDKRYSARIVSDVIDKGYRYDFPQMEFHRSSVTDLAVTIVMKKNQSDRRAVILAPHGTTPVHAFDPERPKPDIHHFVEMAYKALGADAE